VKFTFLYFYLKAHWIHGPLVGAANFLIIFTVLYIIYWSNWNIVIRHKCVMCGYIKIQPQLIGDYPVSLSILLTGGKENNNDSPSNGEWREKSPTAWKPAFTQFRVDVGDVEFGSNVVSPIFLNGSSLIRAKTWWISCTSYGWKSLDALRNRVHGEKECSFTESDSLRVLSKSGDRLLQRLNINWRDR